MREKRALLFITTLCRRFSEEKSKMSGLPPPSAVSDVWPRLAGSTSTGPIPLGGGSTGLPTVNNPNLPLNTASSAGTSPPPVPQPRTPFPSMQRPVGANNSLLSNNYATANTVQSMNPMAMNFVCNL